MLSPVMALPPDAPQVQLQRFTQQRQVGEVHAEHRQCANAGHPGLVELSRVPQDPSVPHLHYCGIHDRQHTCWAKEEPKGEHTKTEGDQELTACLQASQVVLPLKNYHSKACQHFGIVLSALVQHHLQHDPPLCEGRKRGARAWACEAQDLVHRVHDREAAARRVSLHCAFYGQEQGATEADDLRCWQVTQVCRGAEANKPGEAVLEYERQVLDLRREAMTDASSAMSLVFGRPALRSSKHFKQVGVRLASSSWGTAPS
jgi:hypothetical protein